LKDLEADHVLARTDYKEVPRVDYALTRLGRSLTDAIVPLCTLGNRAHGGNDKDLRQARHFPARR
jgi:DNA-binding HxlR family transcriptional regulator